MRIQEWLKKEWYFNVRLDVILGVVVVWCHFVHNVHPIFKSFLSYGMAIAFIGLLRAIYRKFEIQLKLSVKDLGIFLGLFTVYLLFHWHYLFYSLAGDELYHAERSSFILMNLREWIAQWTPLPIEEYRHSIWNLFDIRHMAVVDLWRLISFLILIFSISAWMLWRRVYSLGSSWLKFSLIGVFLIVLAFLGRRYSITADLHPPFRLFPIFVSHFLLGYHDFAFRVPGVFLVSAVSFLFYRMTSLAGTDTPWMWRFLVSLSIGFIPIVYYVSEVVEPSVYGYAAWTVSLLLAWRYLKTRDDRLIVLISAIVGVASVTRQSTVAIWPSVIVLYGLSKKKKDPLFLMRVFMPGVIALPYFYAVKRFGHFLLPDEGSLLSKLVSSVTSGVAPMCVLNSTTLPWALFFLIIFLSLLPRLRWSERLLYLVFFPAYAMFYNIWSFLWGLARYQAEYIAPFLVLSLFLTVFYLGRSFRAAVALCLLFLMGISVELNSNLSLDTNYDSWVKMRITTSANFPYREALNSLKRRDSGGAFGLLGGQPWYGESILWLSGFSMAETIRWRKAQDELDQFWQGELDFSKMQQFFRDRKLSYLVTQDGTRRAIRDRPGHVQKVYDILDSEIRRRNPALMEIASFSGEHGGILHIYQISPSSSGFSP